MQIAKIIKIVLRWYSGFAMAFIVISGIATINDTSAYAFTKTDNIIMAATFLPIAIYIWWEIIDAFKSSN